MTIGNDIAGVFLLPVIRALENSNPSPWEQFLFFNGFTSPGFETDTHIC